MKEKYESLTDFISDIMAAAEEASKEILDDIKTKDSEKKSKKCEKKEQTETEDECNSIINSQGKPVKEKKERLEYTAPKTVPGNITIDNFDHYILNEMVNGWPTYNEQHIIFEQFTEEGYKVPGITEAQLLAVLYNRYKDNPKKLALVRELMN